MIKSFIMIIPLIISFSILSFSTIKKFNNPMTLGIMLFFFTLLSCFNIGLWKMHFMFSYILYISLISGLLILMLYFISILCNETTNMSYFLNLIFLLGPIMTYLFLSLNYNFFYFTNFDQNKLSLTNYQNFWISFNHLYSWPLSMIMIFLMFFLLIFLYFNVKICLTNKFSLRQFKI